MQRVLSVECNFLLIFVVECFCKKRIVVMREGRPVGRRRLEGQARRYSILCCVFITIIPFFLQFSFRMYLAIPRS
jgi:hypothetical protein